MKKLTRKLLLSVFSLGLAVVTLSTTTFAWYTANTTVSATGIQGTTEGEVSGSLEISKKNGNEAVWGPTVALTKTVTSGDNTIPSGDYSQYGDKMVPLQHAGTTLTNLDNVAATEGSYLQFTVYIRSSQELTTVDKAGTPVYLQELSITNTLSNNNTIKKAILHDSYAENVWAANAKVGDMYSVDAVHALNVAFDDKTAGTIGSENYSIGEISNTKPALNFNLGENFDALGYFNAVMQENAGRKDNYETVLTKKKDEYDPIVITTIPDNSTKEIAITVTIWLDGWDKYCFDACQNQSFDIVFRLTTRSDDCTFGTPKTNA